MINFTLFIKQLHEKLKVGIVDFSDQENGEMGSTVHHDSHSLVRIKSIPIKDIVPFEPSKEKIKHPGSNQVFHSLVKTIKSGQQHTIPPITVIKHPSIRGKYLVVDGHHRFEAHKLSGSRTIPSQIVSDKDVSFEGNNPIFKNKEGKV